MSANMDDKRAELLAAALHLFVAFGYDGSGVQAIVEAAEVTKPTLYHYFGSKAGLLETLLDEQLAGFLAGLHKTTEYRHDLPFTLTKAAQYTFSFARSNREPYRLYLSLWLAPRQGEAYSIAERYHERHFKIFEKLFCEAALDHGNMKGRHSIYGVTFLGMLNQYIALGVNNRIALDDALAYRAVHQFMHGIFS